MKKLITVALFLGLICNCLTARASQDVDIPVNRVVLFNSGVGYFQHTGKVSGNAAVKLSFKANQINDVLKSMVLMDFGGGTVRSVNYSPREPLARALKSFSIDLSGDPSLEKLLKQIRGVRIRLHAPKAIEGTIIGVQTRRREIIHDGKTTIIDQPILNLLAGGAISSIPIEIIDRIELVDEALASELEKALALLGESIDTDKRPVEINFDGKGERDVAIGYVTQTPVWKSSYRLVLGEDKPRLQGWAIVENTTDADWENVQLELISGRPISFVQDLYTPLYLDRPVVKPAQFASLRPQMYGEGIETKYNERRADVTTHPSRSRLGKATKMYRSAPAGGMAMEMSADMALAPMRGQLAAGIASIASAGEVGELFRYAIDKPVNLARRRSAMLPIINSPIQAEPVSIYNQQTLARHPLSGSWITNNTDMLLLSGPVTVFDGGTYTGDAQIDNLPPGDKRLISYAVDLKVTVDPSVSSTNQVFSGRINRGVLRISHRRIWRKKYVIKNKADAQRRLIVEHPRHNSRKLLTPKKPAETTPKLYRFDVKVDAGKTTEFTVETEQIYHESIGIIDGNFDAILRYANTDKISEKVRKALEPALDMRRKIGELEDQLAKLANEMAQITVDQQRIRKNLQSSGTRGSPLAKRYLTKLSDQEDRVDKIDLAQTEARDEIARLTQELSDYLSDLRIN